jgi:hypothetical protein
VFEGPSALHDRLGFRARTNEPKLGRQEFLTGDEMAHADFVDRFLLTRFLRFALGLDFTQHLKRLFVLAHQALFVDGEREQRVFGAAQGFGKSEGGLGFGVID